MSHGAQHGLNAKLSELIVTFGAQQREQLCRRMEADHLCKPITLAEDETFWRAKPVLVAMEPSSGFIVTEQMRDRRDAQTWTLAVENGLAGMPFEVVGVTADAAKAIATHALSALDSAVTPDLFHVQHNLAAPITIRLAHQQHQAEKRLRQARNAPEATVEELLEATAQASMQRLRFGGILGGIAEAYHPYDEQFGTLRRGSHVKADLEKLLTEARTLADQTHLPKAAAEAIDKAERSIDAMAEAIDAFHQRTDCSLKSLQLPADVELDVRERLLPALYLSRIAEQAIETDVRKLLEQRAQALLAKLRQPNSPIQRMSADERQGLLAHATSWIALFQRSSSAIEGRNGQLRLHHHGARQLSEQRLAVLTVLHNFMLRRPDGSTAAQRLFERPHQDLFEFLLDNAPPIPRPAQPRPRVADAPLLN